MNMTKHIAALGMLALAYGAFTLPALADFSIAFGRHDYNNDGRWNYREFRDANSYYYNHHPQVQYLGDRELRRQFRRLDTDNDGYVRMGEVRTYRNWD